MSEKLTPDTQVPNLKLPLIGGGTFDLAKETPENFTMVVFYRGLHCPVCKNYLGNLAALLSEYEAAGFNVCLLYTSPSPRDGLLSRMPSSA